MGSNWEVLIVDDLSVFAGIQSYVFEVHFHVIVLLSLRCYKRFLIFLLCYGVCKEKTIANSFIGIMELLSFVDFR